MKKLLVAGLFSLTLCAQGREVRPVKIYNHNKGAIFAPDDLSPNTEIFVYSSSPDKKLTLTAILKVVRCDLEECEARTAKIKKGGSLFTNYIYSTTNLKTGKPGSPPQNLAFATYGGPLTKGYNFGYLRRFGKELRAGLKGGLVDVEIGKVGISGRYVGVQGDFIFSNSDGLELSGHGEIGYLQTTLDFAKISGPEFDENVPYVGVGGNVWKHWTSFFVLFKGGYAHNFYKSKYSDEIADYSVPFSGGLITFELGAGMSF